MNTTRKALIVTGMWVLGLAMLALFGWLVHVRDSTPVETSAQTTTAVNSQKSPLSTLGQGAAASARTAADHLAQGPGSQASHALEAAHRIAEVGMDNSWGAAKTQFTIAEKQLSTAMESLHDGRTGDARAQVQAAATALQRATTAAKDQKPGLPPRLVWGGYQSSGVLNAHSVGVLNANGSKLGQVKSIEMKGGKPVAVLQIGGLKALFGAIERGGTRIEVPADSLVYGPRRSLGYVWVVAPTTATDAGGVSAALQ